jgi:hypothetical protein
VGEVFVKILSLFGGWGWITMGVIILVGWTVIFAIYLRDGRDRQAFLYSLRNYAYVVGIGLLAIIVGMMQLGRGY